MLRPATENFFQPGPMEGWAPTRAAPSSENQGHLRQNRFRQKTPGCRLWLTGILLFILFGAVGNLPLQAQDPTLRSTFPLGGQRGSKLQLTVRGQHLHGAYAVWFDCSELTGVVLGSESLEFPGQDKKPPERGQKLTVEVQVGSTATPGVHALRVISDRGISGPAPFLVHGSKSVLEQAGPHDVPAQAQPIAFPAAVHGRIGQSGEVDFYRVNVETGRQLQFEVLTGSGALPGFAGKFHQPELILCEPGGSWFDPNRCLRLEVEDHSTSYFGKLFYHRPRLIRALAGDSAYLIRVGELNGLGDPEFIYQLHIKEAPASNDRFTGWFPYRAAHPNTALWEERNFDRRLRGDELFRLRARSVPGVGLAVKKVSSGTSSAAGENTSSDPETRKASSGEDENPRRTAPDPPPEILSFQEQEPNDTAQQSQEISFPIILEGDIARAGDTDWFRFQLDEPRSLVLQLETPELSHPYFSPWLQIFEEEGVEVASNIFREINDNSLSWKKTVQPKRIAVLEAGEYSLRLRDLTLQRGGAGSSYRVLVRPLVPHLGSVAAVEGRRRQPLDHVNLVAGKASKLTVVAEQEEGFEGEVALEFENLPEGVRALASVAQTPPKVTQLIGKFGALDVERFLPQLEATTLTLVAAPEAPLSRTPRLVRLLVRPVQDGQVGDPVLAQVFPMMVIRQPEEGTPEDTP